MTIRLSREDIIAIKRGRDALRDEELQLMRWGKTSTQLSLSLADMDSLVSRVEAEQHRLRDSITTRNDYPEVTLS